MAFTLNKRLKVEISLVIATQNDRNVANPQSELVEYQQSTEGRDVFSIANFVPWSGRRSS
jgi:hypothetical protein